VEALAGGVEALAGGVEALAGGCSPAKASTPIRVLKQMLHIRSV